MNRQAILERRGWTFVRIRGTAFHRDREAALVPVFTRLQELGIRPTPHPASQAEAVDGPAAQLVLEIVRRAEELERVWEGEEVEEQEQERARVPRVHSGGGRRWRRS
jgi:hypothetical protein